MVEEQKCRNKMRSVQGCPVQEIISGNRSGEEEGTLAEREEL